MRQRPCSLTLAQSPAQPFVAEKNKVQGQWTKQGDFAMFTAWVQPLMTRAADCHLR